MILLNEKNLVFNFVGYVNYIIWWKNLLFNGGDKFIGEFVVVIVDVFGLFDKFCV